MPVDIITIAVVIKHKSKINIRLSLITLNDEIKPTPAGIKKKDK